MIEDLYNVMRRINDIKSRFGIKKRRSPIDISKSANPSEFSIMQDSAVDKTKNQAALPRNSKTQKTGANLREEIDRIADYYSEKNKVPGSLVKAMIENESGYNPRAMSNKGAMGLMQIMPSIAEEFGIDDPYDPGSNINAGTSFLKKLLESYNGDYKKALAAYNAGKTAVDRSGGASPYKETSDFVNNVIDSYVKNSR
jgi:soluble lytic murein transglycosylase-like protein